MEACCNQNNFQVQSSHNVPIAAHVQRNKIHGLVKQPFHCIDAWCSARRKEHLHHDGLYTVGGADEVVVRNVKV